MGRAAGAHHDRRKCVQLLSLPDINFTFFVKDGDAAVRTQKNSDLDDYGGAFVGSIETPLGYWGATQVTGVVSGFFANVTDTDVTRCRSTGSLSCYTERIVDRPDRPDSIGYDNLTTTAHRDVDYWGANAEARFGKAPAPVPDRGGYLFRLAYVGLGGDVRGIYQDNELRLRGDNSPVNYSETLDTTYSGAFLSVGGEYNLLGYLGIGSSWAFARCSRCAAACTTPAPIMTAASAHEGPPRGSASPTTSWLSSAPPVSRRASNSAAAPACLW